MSKATLSSFLSAMHFGTSWFKKTKYCEKVFLTCTIPSRHKSVYDSRKQSNDLAISQVSSLNWAQSSVGRGKRLMAQYDLTAQFVKANFKSAIP